VTPRRAWFPVGFGTWGLGGQAYGPIDDAQARRAVEAALERGIRLFDTADIYGDGRAEDILGAALAGVADVVIVSKGGYLTERGSEQDFSRDHLMRAIERSLGRLRRSRVDVYLLHSPPFDTLANGAAFGVLDELRDAGLVGETGVSLSTFDSFPLAAAWPGCSCIETILNMLDQRVLDAGFLDRARHPGIRMIARVPLCFGLLSGQHARGTRFEAADQRGRWSGEQIDKWIAGADAFRFLERPDRSLAQAALAFCLAAEGVSCAIPGMKTVEQVEHNVAAADDVRRLSADEFSAARAVWARMRDVVP
jgi:aryl-alcohol dehydrogenase-like predicted oxidoreductase